MKLVVEIHLARTVTTFGKHEMLPEKVSSEFTSIEHFLFPGRSSKQPPLSEIHTDISMWL